MNTATAAAYAIVAVAFAIGLVVGCLVGAVLL